LWQGVSTAVACDNYFNNVVLLMGFEGVNGSTGAPGMNDESPHAHGTASVIGSAVIDTSQFKFGSSSGHNTGVGLSSIGFADSPDWKLSSANSDQYTVECWVRFTTLVANMVVIGEFTGGSDFAFTLQLHTTPSEIVFSTSPDGTFGSSSAAVTTGAGLTTGVWYFVAADKDATGKIRIYVNGVMLGSVTPANSSMFDSTAGLSVTSSGAGNSLNGWVDEVRITKGVARYATDTSFPVPTAAFPRVQCPDPSFSNVVLLMGFEGVNGSTGAPGMVDESSHAHGLASVIGTGAISTTHFEFGSSSLHCTGGGVGYPDHADWHISSSNSDQFTLECWVYLNTIGANNVLISQHTTISGSYGWLWQISTGGEIGFTSSYDGTNFGPNFVSSGAGLTTGVGYQLACDKDATGTIRIYKNGVMVVKNTPANSSIFHTTVSLDIGETSNGGGVTDGWIDEVRITKGVARYASDAGYTVPTAAFPRS
jgi:hypothetical protein